ncbi:MAG TPA: RNA polymerase sigma factor [Longimicrobium sp.]|nr:RNA polymerase sigma factor [Longimicrobium sp.]
MSLRKDIIDAHSSLLDLGRLAQTGNARALDRLLRRVEGPVYRSLVSRLIAAPDAEDLAQDLCQEALIRAAASIGRCTFASDGRLLAWVLTIARNVLLDHLRQVGVRAEVRGDGEWVRTAAAGVPPGDEAAPPCPLETFAAEALDGVSEGTAELLRLRLMAGRSWKEVADTLGIAESAAKRRFQRAQAALRRQILVRVDALPAEARRAALGRLLSPGAVPRADGAAFRSPDTDPGRAAAPGRRTPCSHPSETPE